MVQLSKTRGLRPTALRLAVLALAVCTGHARADDGFGYKLNAFGTLGATHSSEKRADYVSSVVRPTGAGFSGDWSTEVDSRLGAQVSATYGERWSAILQLVTEQQWDGSHRPHVEWANVKYALTPDLGVRAGRVALPVFLFSDTKVAYTLTSVRPATYFYSLLPITHSDGLDASWRSRFGDATNTLTALAGKQDFIAADGSPEGNRFKVPGQYALVDKLEIGALTVQASYFAAHVRIPKLLAIPVPALSQAGDGWFRRAGLAFNYDPGKFFVLGEASRDSAQITGSRRAWYASAGVRLGAFTPYVRYEKNSQGRQSPLFADTSLTSTSVGVRWDFHSNMDLKIQHDRTRMGAQQLTGFGAVGPLANTQSGFRPGGSFSLTSIVLDFVF